MGVYKHDVEQLLKRIEEEGSDDHYQPEPEKETPEHETWSLLSMHQDTEQKAPVPQPPEYKQEQSAAVKWSLLAASEDADQLPPPQPQENKVTFEENIHSELKDKPYARAMPQEKSTPIQDVFARISCSVEKASSSPDGSRDRSSGSLFNRLRDS